MHSGAEGNNGMENGQGATDEPCPNGALVRMRGPGGPATILLVVGLLIGLFAAIVMQVGRMLDRQSLTAQAVPEVIDLNEADAATLTLLPGVGPVMAQAIVDYRQTHGPFHDLEALGNVRNVGPITMRKIAPYVRCGQTAQP